MKYKQDANLAYKIYKAYVTHGVWRLDKVNGRFLASQTIKLGAIIEQNNKILSYYKK